MNKKYIRILAEVAIVLSAAGTITGCVNKRVKDESKSNLQTDIIVTDNKTTTNETIADSNNKIVSSSSLNENSKSSKIESSSKTDSSSNVNSSASEIESSSLNENSLSESSENDSSSEICNSENVQNNVEISLNNINVNYELYNNDESVQDETYIYRNDDTKKELGEPIEDVIPVITEETIQEVATVSDYEPYELYNQGRLYWGDYQYTWYSERVLPGYGLNIDGRHTDTDGFVCDGDGYICVAASSLNKGAVVDTPFGRQGKVYDTGCDWGVIDVYVNW